LSGYATNQDLNDVSLSPVISPLSCIKIWAANSMKIRVFVVALAQVIVSLVVAAYAVREGIPYVGRMPLPWWKSALRWPWWLMCRLSGNIDHPLPIILVLFVIYSGTLFLILHYFVAPPILRSLRQ